MMIYLLADEQKKTNRMYIYNGYKNIIMYKL